MGNSPENHAKPILLPFTIQKEKGVTIMQWNLPVEFYVQDDWHIGHCPALEIMSQGETEDEARENLEDALSLFFECASYSEIMGYLSRIQPVSTPQVSLEPISPPSAKEKRKNATAGRLTLAYA